MKLTSGRRNAFLRHRNYLFVNILNMVIKLPFFGHLFLEKNRCRVMFLRKIDPFYHRKWSEKIARVLRLMFTCGLWHELRKNRRSGADVLLFLPQRVISSEPRESSGSLLLELASEKVK